MNEQLHLGPETARNVCQACTVHLEKEPFFRSQLLFLLETDRDEGLNTAKLNTVKRDL